LVVDATMKMVMDDSTIEAIVSADDVNDARNKYGNGSDLDWRTAPQLAGKLQRSPELCSGLLHIS
ncbi:MAG: hypothetical protein LUG49_07180, partial [Oscillospiraceae bacterium]|nr:hypothetical protein [Oscillospiraceae bacterium]